ncbi:hypothetical protein ISCGN_027924 [Ixodes scapularis]
MWSVLMSGVQAGGHVHGGPRVLFFVQPFRLLHAPDGRLFSQRHGILRARHDGLIASSSYLWRRLAGVEAPCDEAIAAVQHCQGCRPLDCESSVLPAHTHREALPLQPPWGRTVPLTLLTSDSQRPKTIREQ